MDDPLKRTSHVARNDGSLVGGVEYRVAWSGRAPAHPEDCDYGLLSATGCGLALVAMCLIGVGRSA